MQEIKINAFLHCLLHCIWENRTNVPLYCGVAIEFQMQVKMMQCYMDLVIVTNSQPNSKYVHLMKQWNNNKFC